MKRLILLSLTLMLTTFQMNFANAVYSGKNKSFKRAKKTQVVRSEAGLNIPQWGIALDASYDPRLDDLIPDYKILHIAVTNRRSSNIVFNPSKDKWIVMDNTGKKHIVKNHVKAISSKLWRKLPKGLRKKLAYPNYVKPGNMVVIDVFLPKSVDLFQFKQIFWKSHHFSKEFSIYTAYEDTLKLTDADLDSKNIPINKASDDNRNAINDYIKTRDEILNPNRKKYDDPVERKEASRKKQKEDVVNFDPSFDKAIILR